MELHTSENIADTSNISTNNELSLSFDVDNGGNDTVYVDDKLLTNYDVAKARAESIFLDEGYVTKRVTFSTYHIDNLHIGDTIQLDGLLFKVINIVDKIKGAVVSMDITAERAAKSVIVLDVKIILLTALGETSNVVSHSDGYMYAVTYSNGNIYKSIDGEVWAMSYSSAGDYGDTILSHSDGYVYAFMTGGVGSLVYRSTNGTTWSESLSTSHNIAKATSHADGYVYGDAGSAIVRSNDGITWSEQLFSGYVTHSIASHGVVLYRSALFNTEHRIFSSTDGTTWSDIYSSPTIQLFGLVSDGTYLYGCYYDGTIRRSLDGIAWELVFSNGAYDFGTLSVHADGSIYAPSYNNQIVKSDNGSDWEEIYTVVSPTSYLWAICSRLSSVYVFDGIGSVYKLTYTEEVE